MEKQLSARAEIGSPNCAMWTRVMSLNHKKMKEGGYDEG